jgi:hypothetical protein
MKLRRTNGLEFLCLRSRYRRPIEMKFLAFVETPFFGNMSTVEQMVVQRQRLYLSGHRPISNLIRLFSSLFCGLR